GGRGGRRGGGGAGGGGVAPEPRPKRECRRRAHPMAYRVPRRFIVPPTEPPPYGLLLISFLGHAFFFLMAGALSAFVNSQADQSKIYIVNLEPAMPSLGSPTPRVVDAPRAPAGRAGGEPPGQDGGGPPAAPRPGRGPAAEGDTAAQARGAAAQAGEGGAAAAAQGQGAAPGPTAGAGARAGGPAPGPRAG